MDNIVFGHYFPYNTIIHKLDARNKLFISITLIVMIFLQFSSWGTTIIFSCAYFLFLILLMMIAKVSFIDLFKSLKGMWFLILFLFAIYIFIPNPNYSMSEAFHIGSLSVKWDAFYQSGYIILRLIMMLALMMILTSTTKPMDLTSAFEWYMYPLKPLHVPVNAIAMTLSIAIRFIPTILDETKRIMKAQSSRGVDFEHGGLIKKFRAITSLIVPLLASALERSDELANAMEARGYDPNAKRTRYRSLKFRLIDLLALIISLLLLGGVIFVFVYDHNVANIDLFKIWFGVTLK